MTDKATTPAMQQYFYIKEQHPECLLFYRMGDFYELFFDDAIQASKVLNIVLTQRGKHAGESIQMCGVPAHCSTAYLHKLIKHGFKVAICEQLETPQQAKIRGYKAVINREVVQIITPGTIIDEELLEGTNTNYILAVARHKEDVALSWLDISTGAFFYSQSSNLSSDLARIAPKEILIAESLFVDYQKTIGQHGDIFVTKYADSFFDSRKAEKRLCSFYQTKFIANIGELSSPEVSACGALIEYICQTQKTLSLQLGYPKLYDHKYFLHIDATTRKSLELNAAQDGHSLASAIDYTVTNGGGRLLRSYIAAPLADHHVINQRLDLVESYIANEEQRINVRKILKGYPDVERSLSRLGLQRAQPKDLQSIKQGLGLMHSLSVTLENHGVSYKSLQGHDELLNTLTKALNEDNTNYGYIKPSFNQQLAALEYITSNSNSLIADLQAQYCQQTGIRNLKISSNNLIGYYIEVPAKHQLGDESFIHKQSLASCLRYTTSALQELENKIITASTRASALEKEIFVELCQQVMKHASTLTMAIQLIAKLDVVSSLAELALRHHYNRPIVDGSNNFIIKGGRHPVVERGICNFIGNDLALDHDCRINLLTGPNMAGKSTFLRQNALIAILAHIGSYVPAQSAVIGTIDKIFSRVGAADNLAKGQSTFMVEMIETAAIVNQATSKSLVILDEVGRGTALYDGLAIAWAVVENIHNVNKCRAIFATHYHELCDLHKSLAALKCYTMKVQEWHDEIIFLHEVIEGASNKSYGIHVAKLAGLPVQVVQRATEILQFIAPHDNSN